jgi:hypothetical protein
LTLAGTNLILIQFSLGNVLKAFSGNEEGRLWQLEVVRITFATLAGTKRHRRS